MKYRKLGKTGLRVSAIGLGTWQYCGDWGKTFSAVEVEGILRRAGELGFNLVDTAAAYGNHASERLLGQALSGRRNEWVVVSKFGRFRNPDGSSGLDFRPQSVLAQLEDSLRALRTERIDVYLLHSGTSVDVASDELWTALDKQRQAGKIGHFGISLPPAVDENIRQAQLAAERGCEVVMALYNHLDRNPEDGTFHVCRDNGLGVLARVPLAQGYLSGKYKPGAVFAKNDVRAGYYDEATNSERLARAQQIIRHEVPQGVAPAEWAMAWSVRHPAVSACIPGFKSIEQLESGARAAELIEPGHPLELQ